MTTKPNNGIDLIKAIHPADLIEQVNEAITLDMDLCAPLFVSHEGLLCQWVEPSLSLYEYKLVVAADLDTFEKQARNLRELGFDFDYQTVLWNETWYLQWMHRLNTAGQKMREVMVSLADTSLITNLQMVEDVHVGLHLEPTAHGANWLTIPYPVS